VNGEIVERIDIVFLLRGGCFGALFEFIEELFIRLGVSFGFGPCLYGAPSREVFVPEL
jgi:hypothetical protein